MNRREVFMVRDPELYVEYREERIGIFDSYEEVEGTAKAPKLHPKGLEFTRFTEELYLWISRYSAGEDIDALAGFFVMDVIPALENYANSVENSHFNLGNLEEYLLALWTVSISELLEFDEFRMQAVLEITGVVGQDALMDRIVGSRTGNLNTTAPLRHAHIWLSLFEALDFDSGAQQESIVHFLKGWYNGMNELWWFDYHLKDNAGFFGYWSFELAALVKNLKLEDDQFQDNIFYPRDLTGNRMMRSWEDSQEGESAREEIFQQQEEKKNDPSPANIEAAYKDAEKAISQFLGTVLTEKSDKKQEKKFQEMEKSWQFLAESMGLDQKRLQDHPEAAQALVMSMMGNAVKVLEEYQEATEEDMTDLQPAFMEAYKNMEERGLSTEDILKELPPEVLDQFGGLSENEVKVRLSEKMAGFSGAMKDLVTAGDISPEELFLGLEKLAMDFGYVEPEPEDPTAGMQEDVSKRLGERLDKALKKKNVFDFTFDDLWENREE